MYPVTSVLIALNVLIFGYGALFAGESLLNKGSFIVIPGYDPYGTVEPWRYVTSMFLHGGLEHLLFNMFALLVFAPPLEYMLGSVRYAVFYLLCGILANLFSAFMVTERMYSVGASGAIYGVYGAYLYLALMKKALDDGSRKTIYTILIFGVVYSVLVPQVNLWAHVGGALAGFVLGYIYDRVLVAKRRR